MSTAYRRSRSFAQKVPVSFLRCGIRRALKERMRNGAASQCALLPAGSTNLMTSSRLVFEAVGNADIGEHQAAHGQDSDRVAPGGPVGGVRQATRAVIEYDDLCLRRHVLSARSHHR